MTPRTSTFRLVSNPSMGVQSPTLKRLYVQPKPHIRVCPWYEPLRWMCQCYGVPFVGFGPTPLEAWQSFQAKLR